MKWGIALALSSVVDVKHLPSPFGCFFGWTENSHTRETKPLYCVVQSRTVRIKDRTDFIVVTVNDLYVDDIYH